MTWEIRHGHVVDELAAMPAESVDCVVTSPPYWGLRDYKLEPQVWDGWHGSLGLEPTPELYVEHLVQVFAEVRRVLKPQGTLWLNLGDSYNNSDKWGGGGANTGKHTRNMEGEVPSWTAVRRRWSKLPGLKPKDLVGIPWMVAFALRAAGWWLRSDIVWCLSGGTRLYARTQKGDMPVSIKDLARLDTATVKLWNGKKWTQVLGFSQSLRKGDEIEIELRSGERIGCTPNHQWPTLRGKMPASDLKVGDKLCFTPLPSRDQRPNNALPTSRIAFFLGLYLAEGSRSGDTVQISLGSHEMALAQECGNFARWFGGSCHVHEYGKSLHVSLEGHLVNAVVDTFIAGRTARDKHLKNICWNRDNEFLERFMEGYLAGDAHYDQKNERWRLGFTRNYYWAADLRTICARLDWQLRLRFNEVALGDKTYKTYRGEIRKRGSSTDCQIVAIRKSKGRQFWDIGVEDEPHEFALASGILTHNSKPNPMPESVRDRPTKAHEYLFLLAKSQRYYYDSDAVREPIQRGYAGSRFDAGKTAEHQLGRMSSGPRKSEGLQGSHGTRGHDGNGMRMPEKWNHQNGRNLRSVWLIPTMPFPEAHFATFPEKLVEPCIKAGCPEGGVVLDPFAGAGTVGVVAKRWGRRFIGIELNQEYCEMARRRIEGVLPLLSQITPRS